MVKKDIYYVYSVCFSDRMGEGIVGEIKSESDEKAIAQCKGFVKDAMEYEYNNNKMFGDFTYEIEKFIDYESVEFRKGTGRSELDGTVIFN